MPRVCAMWSVEVTAKPIRKIAKLRDELAAIARLLVRFINLSSSKHYSYTHQSTDGKNELKARLLLHARRPTCEVARPPRSAGHARCASWPGNQARPRLLSTVENMRKPDVVLCVCASIALLGYCRRNASPRLVGRFRHFERPEHTPGPILDIWLKCVPPACPAAKSARTGPRPDERSCPMYKKVLFGTYTYAVFPFIETLFSPFLGTRAIFRKNEQLYRSCLAHVHTHLVYSTCSTHTP